MDGLTAEQFYAKKAALMRKMTKKQTKHIYDPDKHRGQPLTVEQQLVKYADSLKYDPNKKAEQSPMLLPYYRDRRESPHNKLTSNNLNMLKIQTFNRDDVEEYGAGDRDSPVLSVRRIHILDGNIKEEQNEDSEFLSTTNLSYL